MTLLDLLLTFHGFQLFKYVCISNAVVDNS